MTPNEQLIKKPRHGKYKSAEYGIWVSMRQRCYNPKAINYKNYGGRGITICKRWKAFVNFLSDMGARPSAIHCIERRNNNGNYSPRNCRWATPLEQSQNTRRARLITLNKETHSIAEWSRRKGMSYQALIQRLNAGWPVKDALTKAVAPRHRRKALLRATGKWKD